MLAQSRLWGGLMALGGVLLGLLCLLWTFSSAGSAGGRIFGLAFVLIVSLPLLAGGAYLFMRGQQEEQAERDVTGRRRTLESESLTRAQLADRIANQRDRLKYILQATSSSSNPTGRLLLEDAMTRLENVSNALRRTSYEREGSFEALAADASDPESVRSIDAALDSGVRRMEEQVTDLVQSLSAGQPNPSLIGGLTGTVSRLENATNERSRVITSGEQKALPTVAELLRGAQPTGIQEPSKFTELKPNDAITYDGEDLVISGRLEWVEGATHWYSYLLGGGEGELWLLVEQGGTRLAIMRPTQVPPGPRDQAATVEGVQWPETAVGTATVTVTGSSGSRAGLFVGYQRFEGPGGFFWIEDWDEGPKAMLGRPEHAESFDLWIR